jgi:hypothetical protein
MRRYNRLSSLPKFSVPKFDKKTRDYRRKTSVSNKPKYRDGTVVYFLGA